MEQGHEEGPRRPGRAFSPEAHTAVHSLHQEHAPVTAARNPTEPAKKAPAAKAAKARLRAKMYRAAVLAVAGPRATARRE